MTPYRSADELEHLGPAVCAHESSTKPSIRGVLVSLGLLVIGLAPFLAAWSALTSEEHDGAAKSVLVMLVSAVAMGIAVWGIVASVRPRKTRVEVYEHGVVLRTSPRPQAMLWTRVGEVLLHGRCDRDDVAAVTVISDDGTRLTVGNELSGFAELRSTIERETSSRLLEGALARLDRDRTVAFGPFEVTHDELRHADQRLPWRDVDQCIFTRGVVAVGSRTRKLRILPKRDGVLGWARVPSGSVPNAKVFLSLVTHLRGSKLAGSEARD